MEVPEVGHIKTSFRRIDRIVEELTAKMIRAKTALPSEQFLSGKSLWKNRFTKHMQGTAPTECGVSCPVEIRFFLSDVAVKIIM